MEWREEGRLWEEEILLSRKDNANEEVAMKNRERESHNPNNNNSWTDVILSQLSFVVTRAKMTMKACQLVGAREANKKNQTFSIYVYDLIWEFEKGRQKELTLFKEFAGQVRKLAFPFVYRLENSNNAKLEGSSTID